MLAPEKRLMTLRQAVLAFRTAPGRLGRFTQLPAEAEVMVAGDMHGSTENLRLLVKKADLERHPQRHLVLQELIHGPFLYPQGGEKSHQMLDLVAALKLQFPARVHYLLGNHELAQWQHQRIGKGDVDQNDAFVEGVRTAYGAHADAIVRCYEMLFEACDLALVTANRVFLSHSLPTAKNLERFDFDVLKRENLAPEDVKSPGTVHSLVWGRDLSQKNVEAFLRKVDADWLISGHIPCEMGFLIPNDRQIVLDALGYPACYCLFAGARPTTQAELLQSIGTL